MEVLHFSTSDLEGGSARSAWRIHSGLKSLGVSSKMLVSQKSSDDENVETVSGSKLVEKFDIYSNIFLQKAGNQYTFIPSQFRLNRHQWFQKAEIIQLYNVHGGYFNLSTLKHAPKKSKIIWRLSDLWPITGHCAYPGDCDRWKSGCGSCPDLETYPSIGKDKTHQLWARKANIYKDLDITIVAPSSWTFDAAKQSQFFSSSDIRLIHNGIDLKEYKPYSKSDAQAQLGISTSKKILFFGAHVAFDNPRKGTDILLEALQNIDHPEEYFLLVAGLKSDNWVSATDLECKPLGFIKDEKQIMLANAAADFVLAPSIVENLPNTIIEAQAMGKPIIAFDSGGIKDAVKHKKNGFLIKERSSSALVELLNSLSSISPGIIEKLSNSARQNAEEKFDKNFEIQRFYDLYEEKLAL